MKNGINISMEIEDGTVFQALCALKVDFENSESTFKLHPLNKIWVTYSRNKLFARVIASRLTTFGKAFDVYDVVCAKVQAQVRTAVRSH